MPVTKLLRGRWVFTGSDTIESGAIAVAGDTIAAIGSWQELRDRYPQAAVLGSERHGVLPGLINAHHHSNGVPNSLLGVDDDFLELWLYSRGAARSQDPQLRTLLSAALLLKTGVTTVVDLTTLGGSVEASEQGLRQQLKAYERSGMRVALAPGARFDSFLVHGEDAAFLASLPNELRQQVETLTPPTPPLTPEAYLEIVSEAVTRYQAHPVVSVWFGPPGPQWVGDALLVKIVEAAERLDTGVQTHVMESLPEKLMGPRFYGKSVIAHLRDLGVLSPRFSMAHGVWLGEADMALLAETGAAISHNPSSNLRLRAGIAPLTALLAQGVTVGLGMDSTTLNDSEDMFAEMRLAARLQRSPQLDDQAPGLAEVFAVATQGGAKLLRQPHVLGRLAPGYRADVVLVNCDRITWPYLAPEADPLSVLLMRASAGDVDTVLVNGEVVLASGFPTGFDLAEVGAAAAEQLAAQGDRGAYRALAKALRPYLLRWYQGWFEGSGNRPVPLNPYIAYNARR